MSSNPISTNPIGNNLASSGGLTEAELDTILADYPTTPTPLTAGRLTVAGAGNTLEDSGWSIPANGRLTTPNNLEIFSIGGGLYTVADVHYLLNTSGTYIATLTASGLRIGSSAAPARRLHVLDTANPQMRLEGSGGTLWDMNAAASGNLVLTPPLSGSGLDIYSAANGVTRVRCSRNGSQWAQMRVSSNLAYFEGARDVLLSCGASYTWTLNYSTTKQLEGNATGIGAFGVTPVARQVVPTGSTADQIITALQNLGWFAQS